MLEKELQLEKGLFYLLNGSDSSFLDNFMWLYSYKFAWLFFYLCFLIVFVRKYNKNWKELVLILVSLVFVITLCDQVSSTIFKPIFERFRPTHHPDFKNHVDIVLGYRGGLYGFISSHSANAFGFATFTALLLKRRPFTVMILIFALLTGYSRIYLGVHFISDVVVGAIVGVIMGYLVYLLYAFIEKKHSKIPVSIQTDSRYSMKEVHFLIGAYIVTLLYFSIQSFALIIK